MALLTPVQIARTGVVYDDTAFSAAAGGGDYIVAAPKAFLAVKNADSGSHTVTVVTPGTVDGYAIADQDVVVAAGVTKLIGPFGSVFSDPDKHVTFTYDGVTAVSVKAFLL